MSINMNGNFGMRYRLFGKGTGLRVSELALGCGLFGTQWGYGADLTESRRMFNLYLHEAALNECPSASVFLISPPARTLSMPWGEAQLRDRMNRSPVAG